MRKFYPMICDECLNEIAKYRCIQPMGSPSYLCGFCKATMGDSCIKVQTIEEYEEERHGGGHH